jgi:sortase A
VAVSDREEPPSGALPPPTMDDDERFPAPEPVDRTFASTDANRPSSGGRRTDVKDRRRPEARETQEKPQRSTARRITFWVGIGLIGAGLALLGYVAWQLWGTNWISKREQKRITKDLTSQWNVGQGCDSFCPKGTADALIRIPKFGKDYVIPVIEGTSQDILAKGFGHFIDTAPAGSVTESGKDGNYALAGHRVTHGEPLRNMPDLRPGDEVIVETLKHTYIYKLDTNPNDLIIDFSGTWVLDPFPKNPNNGVTPKVKPDAPDPSCHPSKTVHCDIKDMYKKLITLTTCSEIFHTDNRMIAFGHLIEIRDKQVVTAAP